MFSSPEPKAPGELTGWKPPSFTLSNWNSFAAASISQPNFICSMSLVVRCVCVWGGGGEGRRGLKIACICILGKLLKNLGCYGN